MNTQPTTQNPKMAQPSRTVFEIFYRISPAADYKQYKTTQEITDFSAACQLRTQVAKLKGTKDVFVTTSKVRSKLNGTTVSEKYNFLIRK